MQNLMRNNESRAKLAGYYALKENAFHDLKFCHEKGINLSSPVEPLHCVLLGLFIQVLQGFNHIQHHDLITRHAAETAAETVREDEDDGLDSDDTGATARKQKGKEKPVHYVFTGKYKELVENQLLQIGFILQQQCDDDMPRTFFPSGYFPDNQANDNSTGKNSI